MSAELPESNGPGRARGASAAGPICRAAPAWFARVPGRRPWSRRPVILAAVAVLALLGGAALALAVTGPPAPSLTSTIHHVKGHRPASVGVRSHLSSRVSGPVGRLASDTRSARAGALTVTFSGTRTACVKREGQGRLPRGRPAPG
ncbi:MAG: hypothetical protein ACLPUO_04740 [Streptosporangiaceae bacterium]